MPDASVQVRTFPDGSLVVQPHGSVGPDHAVELQQTLVNAVRKVRPLRLVLDLSDVTAIDPINLGSLAAACYLADAHSVAVFVDCNSAHIAGQLAAAGVPLERLRTTPTVI